MNDPLIGKLKMFTKFQWATQLEVVCIPLSCCPVIEVCCPSNFEQRKRRMCKSEKQNGGACNSKSKKLRMFKSEKQTRMVKNKGLSTLLRLKWWKKWWYVDNNDDNNDKKHHWWWLMMMTMTPRIIGNLIFMMLRPWLLMTPRPLVMTSFKFPGWSPSDLSSQFSLLAEHS